MLRPLVPQDNLGHKFADIVYGRRLARREEAWFVERQIYQDSGNRKAIVLLPNQTGITIRSEVGCVRYGSVWRGEGCLLLGANARLNFYLLYGCCSKRSRVCCVAMSLVSSREGCEAERVIEMSR